MSRGQGGGSGSPGPLATTTRAARAALARAAILAARGNLSAAARAIGCSRRRLLDIAGLTAAEARELYPTPAGAMGRPRRAQSTAPQK